MNILKNRKMGIRVKILVPSILVLLLVCILMSTVLQVDAASMLGMMTLLGTTIIVEYADSTDELNYVLLNMLVKPFGCSLMAVFLTCLFQFWGKFRMI